MCSIDSLELVMKGIEEVYDVDDQGQPNNVLQTYLNEAYPSYYNCSNCRQDWMINAVQSQQQAFKLAKEHLNEEG